LIYLSHFPLERTAPAPSEEPDWSGFFTAAGLDPALFVPVEPEWSPPVGSSHRFAWTGAFAERPNVPIRVEAAAMGPAPVWFEVIPPWQQPLPPVPEQKNFLSTISGITFVSVFATALIAAAILARRNLRRKRGDRNGAWMIAVAAFIAFFGRDLFGMEHVASPHEVVLIMEKLTTGFGYGFTFWLFYIALEPYLRRRWPRVLIGWARLVSGKVTDPRVGREVLTGIIAGMAVSITFLSLVPLSRVFGPALAPGLFDSRVLGGFEHVVATVFNAGTVGIRMTFIMAVVLLLAHALLRNRPAAVVVTVVLIALTAGTQGENVPLEIAVRLIATGILALTLVRVGLIAAIIGFSSMMLMPMVTLDPDSWFFAPSMFLLAIPIALAAWGFRTALGSNPLFADAVLEE
jgi:hypothetical protein